MGIIKQFEMGEKTPIGISCMIWKEKKWYFVRIPLPIKKTRYSYVKKRNCKQRLNLYFTRVIPVHFDWNDIDDENEISIKR